MGTFKKILLVDDVPLFLELERSFLSGLGAQVLTARDGQEAVETARRELPDLIVMDLMMPQMNGDEACRILKSDPATGKIPILLVTAQESAKAAEQCKGSGCDGILAKPVRRNELLDQINRFAPGRQAEAPLGRQQQILLVQDSRFYASLLQDVLGAKGYRIEWVATESEANAALRSAPPDLVLLDLLATRIRASEWLGRLRADAAHRRIKVVALTSLSRSDPAAQEAVRLGAQDFISKTTPPLDIAYRIDEILFAAAANTRRKPRYTVRGPLEYKKGQFWIVGELANVSNTGICVRALELPEMGAHVVVRFVFPHQEKPCEEEGDVAWVQTPDAPRTGPGWLVDSGFGLRFTSPSERFQKSLKEYVQRQGLS